MTSYRNPAFLRSRWLAGPLLLFAANASATVIQVFTDHAHPVEAMPGVQIVELDAPISLELQLSSGLPANPSLAVVIARARLSRGGLALQRKMAAAYQAVADAWNLGVKKIPAVVMDRRYVVYGISDVARAVSIIDRYRRQHR